MLQRLRAFIASPTFPDEGSTRIAKLLHRILIAVSVGAFVSAIAVLLSPAGISRAVFPLLILLLCVVCLALLRRWPKLASFTFTSALWLITSASVTTNVGVRSASFGVYVVVIILAAVLLSERASIAYTLLTIVTGVLLVYVERQGLLFTSPPPPSSPESALTIHLTVFLAAATLLYMTGQSIRRGFARVQESEQKLVERNRELEHQITERQRVEAERDRYFELSLDLIVVANLDGSMRRANPAFEKTLGYAYEELLTQPFTDFIYPDDRENTLREMENLQAGRSWVDFENRCLCKDGQVKWLSWNARSADGLIYATARDVTEQKQMTETLRTSEEKYRSLFENTGLSTVIYDRDGTILLVNKRFAEYYEKDESYFLGKSLFTALPANIAEYHQQQTQRVFATGKGNVGELETSPNRWFLLNTQPLMDAQGTLYAFQAVSTEITAHKQLEKQERELAITLEKATFLSEFLGTISHDIKTPLSVINTSLYLLERYDDPEKQRDRIGQIKEQTHLVEKFIQDILTVSRLDYSPPLNPTEIHINSLLSDIVQQLCVKADDKQIAVHLELAKDVAPILANADDMQRAFTNLIDNALNYTPTAGSVTVRTYSREPNVIVEVADTGIGIGEEDLPHIFERFYRASQAQALDKRGTGLGLAIVKKILDLHHGTIEVNSVIGQGTTFRTQLPIENATVPM
jgi:PAS domain S-box-containing protein